MDISIIENRSVEAQVKKLKKIISTLKIDSIPEGDGIYIPAWNLVSKSSYQNAVLRLLVLIGKEYGLHLMNFYQSLPFNYLDSSETSIAQNGGFLSEISVFGNKNMSAVDAESDEENYCLGVYEFLIIFITNYEKFVGRSLFVVCPADKMCPITGGRKFTCTPIVKIGPGEISLFSYERDQKLSFAFAFGKN